jgi:glycosyltransferase involved in cell wall biosynthesis
MIILTTSYNCEKFIEKSLLSIMSQRFKEFTCYITDDLSTDNTINIIKNTIKNDSNLPSGTQFKLQNGEKYIKP